MYFNLQNVTCYHTHVEINVTFMSCMAAVIDLLIHILLYFDKFS